MKAILATALAALWAAQDKESCFPAKTGYWWTYSVDGKERKIVLGHPEEIQVAGQGKVRALPLEGFEDRPAYLLVTEDGVKIVGSRRIGFAAVETLVLIADLRWAGDEKWSFSSRSG
jgi:hypothetical protein